MAQAESSLDKRAAVWAKGLIRNGLARRGLTYSDLAVRLRLIGVDLDERSLKNRVGRGSFSAVFLMQCLTVLGVDQIENDFGPSVLGVRATLGLEAALDVLNSGASELAAHIEFEHVVQNVDVGRTLEGRARYKGRVYPE